MAKRQSTYQFPVGAIVFSFAVAAAVLIVLLGAVFNGPGSTESRATRDAFLTPDDDALSLQEDLRRLENDPTADEESLLKSMQ